ncbi:MAG: hypothetical protein IIX69_03080, partial [Clostridia bacterium]|nr:hypothetical protein [Clostridia bacterium]
IKVIFSHCQKVKNREISAEVNIGAGAKIFVTTDSLDALDAEAVTDTVTDTPGEPNAKKNGKAAVIAGIAAGACVAAAVGIIAAKAKKRKK